MSVFAVEGDNFKGYSFDWVPIEKLILEEIFQVVQKLEINILDIPTNIVSKVTDIIYASTKIGIKFGWIDRVLGKIGRKEIILSCSERLDC